MVDANQVFSVNEALRRGRVYEELGCYWFEEPLRADDTAGLAQLARALTIPIASGENNYGKRQFRDLFERRAVDIVQPDLRRAGGADRVPGDRAAGRRVQRALRLARRRRPPARPGGAAEHAVYGERPVAGRRASARRWLLPAARGAGAGRAELACVPRRGSGDGSSGGWCCKAKQQFYPALFVRIQFLE